MSVKIMSAIFETEFRDLDYVKDGEPRRAKASTCKLVLLAIADHANDYGESAYPGFRRLEIKTGLSRQGIADTLDALKYNGILSVDDQPSRLNTNVYNLNLRAFPNIAKELPEPVKPLDQSSHLTTTGQATLHGAVKPLDQNHHLTINKPSMAQAPKFSQPMPLDWQLATEQEEITLPDDNQKWQAERDIALMKICVSGMDLEKLAAAFMDARKMLPKTQKEVKSWTAALREMRSAGIKPEHITRAISKLTQSGMTIADPWAVIKTARDLSAKPEGYDYELLY